MKNIRQIIVLSLFFVMTANVLACSGMGLPVGFFCSDSIPSSDKGGIVTPAMSWMYVQEKMDGTYHVAYDETLRIHYEEPYSVADFQRLRFRILDKYRNIIVETNEAGQIENHGSCANTLSPTISTGENWLTINLTCLGLDEDYYYLEVWNGKGEISYLRFLCLPANSIKN